MTNAVGKVAPAGTQESFPAADTCQTRCQEGQQGKGAKMETLSLWTKNQPARGFGPETA